MLDRARSPSGTDLSLEMNESMTMVFRVQDEAMLEMVAPGDKIGFDVERQNGALTITVLEKRD